MAVYLMPVSAETTDFAELARLLSTIGSPWSAECVQALASDRDALDAMGQAARKLAHPGAAQRAAGILEEVAR